MSAEAVLAAAYAGVLVLGAFVLEWLSAHTHARAQRFRTAGFAYDAEHDHWRCPEGQHLWPHEFDHERRFVRYRAKAHICNGCPSKARCTDSDRGRELVRPLDPWPHSEAGRFHRVVALMVVALALLVTVIAAIRNHAPAELALLGAVLAAAVAAGAWLARDLRRHPDGFPAALPATAADGVRAPSRYASQR